jgi:hypothetical protein
VWKCRYKQARGAYHLQIGSFSLWIIFVQFDFNFFQRNTSHLYWTHRCRPPSLPDSQPHLWVQPQPGVSSSEALPTCSQHKLKDNAGEVSPLGSPSTNGGRKEQMLLPILTEADRSDKQYTCWQKDLSGLKTQPPTVGLTLTHPCYVDFPFPFHTQAPFPYKLTDLSLFSRSAFRGTLAPAAPKHNPNPRKESF